jgi:hypothetical protein
MVACVIFQEYATQPPLAPVYIDREGGLSQHTPFGATPQSFLKRGKPLLLGKQHHSVQILGRPV